ncbi:hypothetical protein D3C72_1624900 [compost metagenome]
MPFGWKAKWRAPELSDTATVLGWLSTPVARSKRYEMTRSSPRSATSTKLPAGSACTMWACGPSWSLVAKPSCERAASGTTSAPGLQGVAAPQAATSL